MSQRYEYSGFLTEYYETGMECLGFILQDTRGVTPNPQYDPTKATYPHHIPEWYSLSYAVFFEGGEEIEVYRPDGSLEFKGVLTKDLKAMHEKNYHLSFIPREISYSTWMSWFREKRKARVWSNSAPIAEMHLEKFNK